MKSRPAHGDDDHPGTRTARARLRSLCCYLRDFAVDDSEYEGPSSLTRVMLARGQDLHVGTVILPVIGLSQVALRRRFNLSPMQARVAELMAARLRNDEIAQVLERAPGTIRTSAQWVHTLSWRAAQA